MCRNRVWFSFWRQKIGQTQWGKEFWAKKTWKKNVRPGVSNHWPTSFPLKVLTKNRTPGRVAWSMLALHGSLFECLVNQLPRITPVRSPRDKIIRCLRVNLMEWLDSAERCARLATELPGYPIETNALRFAFKTNRLGTAAWKRSADQRNRSSVCLPFGSMAFHLNLAKIVDLTFWCLSHNYALHKGWVTCKSKPTFDDFWLKVTPKSTFDLHVTQP